MGCVGEIRDRVRRGECIFGPPKVEVSSCDELLLCIFFGGGGGVGCGLCFGGGGGCGC